DGRSRRHGDQDRRFVSRVLARYRTAAPRDLSVLGEGPRALPDPRRGFLPAARGGGEAGAREGAVLLLPGWSQGVLRHPEGGAAGGGRRRRSRSAAYTPATCSRPGRVEEAEGGFADRGAGVRGHRKRAGRVAPEHWTGPRIR